MLMPIAITLVILWALGFFAVQIGGGMIHILLFVAVVVFISGKIVEKRSV